MRVHHATFANFICKFGQKKGMLDYFESIVLPAFNDLSLERSYGKRTSYRFFNIQVVQIPARNTLVPTVALIGRFIKDTVLARDQVFDAEAGLIPSQQEMRSAPSVFFVLLLNNHRLIYFPETRFAPDLVPFRATVSQFLKRKHKEYIDIEYARLRKGGEKITKKRLRELNPSPELNIVPMTTLENIESFIGRYDLLQFLELDLIDTNADIDGVKVIQNLKQYGGKWNPDSLKVTARNPTGLDKEEVGEAVSDATKAGNQEVVLRGKDKHGNELTAKNEDFMVTSRIKEIPSDQRELASKLNDRLNELVEEGVIRIDEPENENRILAILERIIALFF